ncbi:hypothetical protein [Streptomyces nigrescens]|uniref:hypothetical protein n=1 Tax=Streptomyces nigrescens TaxID=1920 RepID=UPI0036F680F2
MAKHHIYFQTTASTVVEIELPDDVTDPEAITEAAEKQINFPTLCGPCEGSHAQNLTLSDEWTALYKDGKRIGEPGGR